MRLGRFWLLPALLPLLLLLRCVTGVSFEMVAFFLSASVLVSSADVLPSCWVLCHMAFPV